MINHYLVLGIENFATEDQIIEAYKTLLNKYNSDNIVVQPFELKIEEIQYSYEFLIDSTKRAELDDYLKRSEKLEKDIVIHPIQHKSFDKSAYWVLLTIFISYFILAVNFNSCFKRKSNNQPKNIQGIARFISENDTAFSKDILDITSKINKDPYNADLYYKRGNAFYYQKRINDAIIDFETAVLLNENNAVYHFRLGESYLLLDSANPIKALANLQKATTLKNDFYEAEFALAKLYLYRQMYEKAIKGFEKLERQPEYTENAIFFKGMAFKEQKDTLRAMQHFDKVLQINPQHYNSVMQIATMYAGRDKDLALNYYDRALAIDETSDEAYYGKGFFLQKRGEYSKALTMYDKARLINSSHKMALYNSAVIMLAQGNHKKCLDFCNIYVEMDAHNANALALRGMAFEKMGNKKAALKDYNAALVIDPVNKPALAGKQVLNGN